MKRRINTVLKKMTQGQLAEIMGVTQARISQLVNEHGNVWVWFDDNNEITSITYETPSTMTIWRKYGKIQGRNDSVSVERSKGNEF